MDSELEVIHHEMEEKRASLAEKLDTLEHHVLGTVHEATDAVSHTVEDVKSVVDHTVDDVKSVVDTVKDSIQGTVESVTESLRNTFDVSGHIRRHPWGMFCGAVAIGFVGGQFLIPRRAETSAAPAATPPAPAPAPAYRETATEPSEPHTGINELLEKVKGLALGSLMGMVRDFLSQALPETLKADVMGVVDNITTKIGGKPQPASTAKESDGVQASPSTGEPSHDDQTQEMDDDPNGAREQRSQGSGKKSQSSGGRFDRRNPPPRR